MKTNLSIIIPCYNCAGTLKEAVDSCYRQGLADDAFEVIMVDDGSHDETRSVMEALRAEHANIRLLFHSENRGGGAARNTGIKEARGEIMYCLDSDNFFAPQSVPDMLVQLETSGMDGVAFYERRFFTGANTRRYHSHYNALRPDSFRLFDIFNNSKTLLDNFFYTKAAYQKTGGYPEHHGFDTQCFEVRFLAAGNTLAAVPNSVFWHRQAGTNKSYFVRVYESGEFSLNLYYILEDIFHLLSPRVREKVLAYDVFRLTKMGQENLIGMLQAMYATQEKDFFIADYERYLIPNGRTAFLNDHPHDQFVKALHYYSSGQYKEANSLFLDYLHSHGGTPLLYFNCLRCAVGASGTEKATIEKIALQAGREFSPQPQHLDLSARVTTRIINKLRSFLS